MSNPVTQCAWCSRYKVADLFTHDFDRAFAARIQADGVTHGICPDCYEDVERERDELLSGFKRRSAAGQQADRGRAADLQRKEGVLSAVREDAFISR